jgi:hypothetical protein
MKTRNFNKLICVGLHKTGTKSLAAALRDVGLNVTSWFGINDPEISSIALKTAAEILEKHDAAQDDPWFILYKELDLKFPGSKFILTTRDSKKWYKSALKHFGGSSNEVRKWFYGEGNDDPVGHEEIWITRKERHENKVREYFKDRPYDFLEMDFEKGDGWDKLGPFLGIDKKEKFPKANTRIGRTQHQIWEKYDNSKGFKKMFYRVLLKVIREINSRY